MRTYILVFLFLAFAACKEGSESKTEAQEDLPIVDTEAMAAKKYPEALNKVFEAHGGLENWRRQRTLTFTMGEETHTIDLRNRKDQVAHPDYRMGYNGEEVWIDDPKKSYQGDPVFYHNLMFYFYAMPFVLADDGIQYEAAAPLSYEGTEYPGLRISYEPGTGVSPDDEYFLYYHPVSYRMEWLGYTVTYGKDGPSKDVHWIRYEDWQDLQGLLLPETLSWYEYEGMQPTTERNKVGFTEVSLSSEPMPDDFFEKEAQ